MRAGRPLRRETPPAGRWAGSRPSPLDSAQRLRPRSTVSRRRLGWIQPAALSPGRVTPRRRRHEPALRPGSCHQDGRAGRALHPGRAGTAPAEVPAARAPRQRSPRGRAARVGPRFQVARPEARGRGLAPERGARPAAGRPRTCTRPRTRTEAKPQRAKPAPCRPPRRGSHESGSLARMPSTPACRSDRS